MGKNTEYSGYESFDYLEPEMDYRPFDLPGVQWGDPYTVPLSTTEEERAARLAEESIVISLHEHPFYYPKRIEKTQEYFNQGRRWTGYRGFAQSNLDAVFDNLGHGASGPAARMSWEYKWEWDDIIWDLGIRLSDIAKQDFLIKCESVDDIRRAFREGQVAWIPAHEGSAMIGYELDRIDILYGFGIRMLGVTYSRSSTFGTGVSEDGDGGLTSVGRRAVDRMNKLGMAIDISHASDRTSLDVCEASRDPVFTSHTGARSLWDTKRLTPDECLHACAETGGVIGITAAPYLTLTETSPRHTIESVMEHFQYVEELVGIDHVSFGPDLIFGDQAGYDHYFTEQTTLDNIYEFEGVERIANVRGMDNPAEAWDNIVRWLVKHGYSDEEIKKVLGENTLRALEQIW